MLNNDLNLGDFNRMKTYVTQHVNYSLYSKSNLLAVLPLREVSSIGGHQRLAI